MLNTSMLQATKKLYRLMSSDNKAPLFKMLAFTSFMAFFEMITATVFALFSQVLVNPQTGKSMLSYFSLENTYTETQLILGFAIALGLVYLVKNSIGIVEIFFQHLTVQKINYQFKKKFLKRFINIDYKYYLTLNSMEGYAFVSRDADTSFCIGLGALTLLVSEALMAVALTAFIVILNPMLAFIVFGIGAISALILTKWLLPTFYKWGLKVQETALLGDKNLLQFFHAFKEIIVLNKKSHFINNYHQYSKMRAKIQAKQNAANVVPRFISELLFVGLFVVAIIYFTSQGTSSASMMGVLGGYLYVSFRMMPGLNRIITQLNTFKSVIPCIDRTYTEYFRNSEVAKYEDCPQLEFQRSIDLNDISFRYLGAEKSAIDGLSFQINKGECIGIIGKTGSGKSTLSDLILGLLGTDRGKILVDGKYPVCSKQWHQKIGYVQQTVYLIDDTIEANIAFGEPPEMIDKSRLEAAIDGAQLREFVQGQPKGLQAIVGDRGLALSGGERQRIAIARALYRDPEVFILDEATSALDQETERQIMQTVARIQKSKKTMIIIAHRLSTLKYCDRIIKVASGKIEKVLDYHELMASYPNSKAEQA